MYRKIVTFQDVQYIVKKNYANLQESMILFAKTELCEVSNEERTENLVNTPCTGVSEGMGIRVFIEECHEILKMALVKHLGYVSQRKQRHKPVSRWTGYLTIIKRRTN